MKPTQELHELGQSLWLDNITRDMLGDGTLQRYIDELSVTGLTSNPTIFDKAICEGDDYDEQIRRARARAERARSCSSSWRSRTCRAPPTCSPRSTTRTDGVDGWVSLEVSPLLAYDTAATIERPRGLHAQRASRANLFIKIPGTQEGLPAIEESIFAGVPINVTLLFSREQYLAAAEAYMRGLERRIEAGLDPEVASVASIFVSRWDKAVEDTVPAELRDKLGIAIAKRAYRAYREAARLRALAEARRTRARVRSGCCSPAPGPRTPTPPTRSTSRSWRRRSRSTRCPTRRSRRSPTTARSASRCPPTAATPSRRWPSSPRPASTSTRWPRSSRRRAPRPSTSPGSDLLERIDSKSKALA